MSNSDKTEMFQLAESIRHELFLKSLHPSTVTGESIFADGNLDFKIIPCIQVWLGKKLIANLLFHDEFIKVDNIFPKVEFEYSNPEFPDNLYAHLISRSTLNGRYVKR